jgi:lipopolysaccharide export system protein LptC
MKEPKLTKNADVNLENNDIQTESAVITGGEPSHLSPDAAPKL